MWATLGHGVPSTRASGTALLSPMLEHEMARVEPLLAEYGYVAVFAAIFVEGFGIPAPGQTLLLAGAALAARGELSLPLLLVTAASASAAGPVVGWWIGRAGGRALLARFGDDRLRRVDALFSRYGGGVVAFGRFLDGIRQLSGMAAGAFEMPIGRFLVWNVAGAISWATFWGTGAWLFARDFNTLAAAAHAARRPLLGIAFLAALGCVAWIARGRRRGHEAA